MDEELEDDDPAERVLPAPKRGNKWLVIGAFFELLQNISEAFAAFFEALTSESLAKFRFQRNQEDFMQQASREIEMMTSGEIDAATFSTGRSIGPGTPESKD